MSARFTVTSLRSPIAGISDSAWSTFVAALEVQSSCSVSRSGGLGAFDLRPRRLLELGIASNLQWWWREKRLINVCVFVPPLNERRLLKNPLKQYAVLVRSIRSYHQQLQRGELTRPQGVSVAGALAILHRGGRGALAGWPHLFQETRRLYEAARGAF